MNIKLNLGGARKVASGLPWVAVKDLEHFKQPPPSGELVRLQDVLGNFLAHAVSEGPRSQRPYRILARERHPEFGAAFFAAAVETALRRRQAPGKDSDGQRLIHGEADGLPGVFCERHGGNLFLEIQGPGLRPFSEMIEEALWRQSPASALWQRAEEGGWVLRRGAPALSATKVLSSSVAGLKFWLRLDEEVLGDFDLEQRLNYARLGALGLKGEALVVFSGRGAWTAAALQAGCEGVLCLEKETLSNTQAAESLELNAMRGRVEFLQGDALERLEKLKAQGRRFGLVMACLPNQSASSRLKFQASKHTAPLAAKAFSILQPGGIAAFSLANAALSQAGFLSALQRGALQAGVAVEVAATGRNAADFPDLAGYEQPLSRRFLALSVKA